MSVTVIMNKILSFDCHHVVLTGGEPMIAKGIRELAARLKDEGKHITIETAGTIAPDGICCDLASLSPKLQNSAPPLDVAGAGWIERHEKTRLQPKILRQWINEYTHQLKFVVSDNMQLTEIGKLVNLLDASTPSCNILLMPEGTSKETILQKSDWLVEACKLHGYRYCQRLHIDLFGNSRGT